jgi:cytidylate kinase
MMTARTIRALARVGHSVIVGRGGQFVLQSLPHVVHVRLVAPMSWRRDAIRRERGISDAEAEKVVREIDDERSRFIRHHFGYDTADPAHYHAVINAARLKVDRIASIIADMLDDVAAD